MSDLSVLSGLFGLAGSILLAMPLLAELRDRKFWDRFNEFRQQKALAPEETSALSQIRDTLIDDRLGRYRSARLWTLGGLLALGLAFALSLVDAATSHAPPSGDAVTDSGAQG